MGDKRSHSISHREIV